MACGHLSIGQFLESGFMVGYSAMPRRLIVSILSRSAQEWCPVKRFRDSLEKSTPGYTSSMAPAVEVLASGNFTIPRTPECIPAKEEREGNQFNIPALQEMGLITWTVRGKAFGRFVEVVLDLLAAGPSKLRSGRIVKSFIR